MSLKSFVYFCFFALLSNNIFAGLSDRRDLLFPDSNPVILNSRIAPYSNNLLQNPNAETGDTSGWAVSSSQPGGNFLANKGRGFTTSYSRATKEQLVDLLANGFSEELMDMQPPISFGESFSKVYCSDVYFLEIELLDANKNLLFKWSSGDRKHNSNKCDYEPYTERLEHQLTHYGPGVRFIRWRDGGIDSEYWLGHFGAMLHDPFLTVLPINLLQAPDQLSSWKVIKNGGNGFMVTGSGRSSQFRTSWNWGVRTQLIDLLQSGYSAKELDEQFPILVSGRYGKVGCADQYFLKAQLLNANKDLIASWDSGRRTHTGNCNPGNSETLSHLFRNYGSGVRYVRFEDGGKDNEFWIGHHGAVLQRPYVGLFNIGLFNAISPLKLQSKGRKLSNATAVDWTVPIIGGGGAFALSAIACLTPAAPITCPAALIGAGAVGVALAGATITQSAAQINDNSAVLADIKITQDATPSQPSGNEAAFKQAQYKEGEVNYWVAEIELENADIVVPDFTSYKPKNEQKLCTELGKGYSIQAPGRACTLSNANQCQLYDSPLHTLKNWVKQVDNRLSPSRPIRVAVNANWFEIREFKYGLDDVPCSYSSGLIISNSKVISPEDRLDKGLIVDGEIDGTGLDTILFYKTGTGGATRAEIVQYANIKKRLKELKEAGTPVNNAVSGFQILKNGEILNLKNIASGVRGSNSWTNTKSRSGIGIMNTIRDGKNTRSLVIITVGINKEANAVTAEKFAEYFKNYAIGAGSKIENVINLDNSGSSQWYYRHPENDKEPIISDPFQKSGYRPIPSFLGIR